MDGQNGRNYSDLGDEIRNGVHGVDEDITLSNAPLRMRGRGNGSWIVSEKKSYRIKFDKKTNLLGQGKGKAKSWTLLAIHNDKSLLRNEAAFYFASHLENIPFVSSSSFVELYLNGEYRGVYEVCDQIQVHKARINIDETGAESNIAFLVELDQIANDDVIEISSGDKFEIKSNYSDESQKKYIQQYMDNSFRSILTADKVAVEKWIDIPSAVDCYIVEEFMKNLDVGWGSFYFTKPKDGKLYFGPVWDFNLTAGNAEDSIQPSVLTSSFRSYKYTYVGNGSFWYKQQNLWFYALRQCPWFNEMVRERWKQVRPFAE